MGMRTDLIREARELHPDIAGVTEETKTQDGCTVSHIAIETEAAAQKLDKPRGSYVTVETEALVSGIGLSEAETVLTGALSELLPAFSARPSILLIGLGNRDVTPDSLGPRVIDRLLITRHIEKNAPELAPKGMRSVSALSPGVLGTTGIETVEIVKGVSEHVRPDLLLCIDALSARRSERIGSTIQLNDSGIQPGSGIGNTREGLTRASLGVPVLCLGVPLVVYAATLAADVMRVFAARAGAGSGTDAMTDTVREIVNERYGPMIITPKEIDTLLSRAAGLLSGAINRVLHAPYYDEIEAWSR